MCQLKPKDTREDLKRKIKKLLFRKGVSLIIKMSRPEIMIQKKRIIMKEETNYQKRTQRDYTMTFKLNVVREVESGELTCVQAQRKYGIQARSTITTWLRKYGKFDWENQTLSNMPKSPEQRILELEAKIKLLEKQKAQLERQNHIADSKAAFFDIMIDIAEKEYNIDVRKNYKPAQSIVLSKRNKKA